MDPLLKMRIEYFCLKWGRRAAGEKLRASGLKPSMVNKLLSGNYYCQPDEFRLKMLERALGNK